MTQQRCRCLAVIFVPGGATEYIINVLQEKRGKYFVNEAFCVILCDSKRDMPVVISPCVDLVYHILPGGSTLHYITAF